MTQEQPLHHQLDKQMTKYRKTLQELHLLKRVSKDLRNYKKMIQLKKYD